MLFGWALAQWSDCWWAGAQPTVSGSMISMVARVNKTFARFGEHIGHSADNHAGESTRQFIRPFEGFDCGLETVDKLFGRVWFAAPSALYAC